MRTIRFFKYYPRHQMILSYKTKRIYPENIKNKPNPKPEFKECFCVPGTFCRGSDECWEKIRN